MLAIVATLLVLDIVVQPPGTLLQQVLHAWPGYLAYAVSFLTIGGTWLVHTALTDRLTRSDPIFLQLNLVLLLVVAFLPFPTKLVTDALHVTADERVAITIYGLTLLAIRLLTAALDAYARREHLYSPQEEGHELRSAQRKLLPATIGYVIAIAIGLLAAPGGGGTVLLSRGIPDRAVRRDGTAAVRGSRQFLRCWAATTTARCGRSSGCGRVRCSCSTACCGSTHDGPFG